MEEDSMKSRIITAMNFLASMIDEVEITSLGETKYYGELIKIKFKDGQIKFINTRTNVISNSYKVAMTRLVSNCKLQNGRLTTVIGFANYPNGTRFQLGLLIALADEFNRGIIRDTYTDLEVNHKDRSGNNKILKFINNRIYNLELVESGKNKRHWRIVEYISKNLGVAVGFSADNKDLMDLLEYKKSDKRKEDLDTLKKDILNHISFHDEFGTTFLA